MSLSRKANRLIQKPKGRIDTKFKRGEGKTKDIMDVIMMADKLSYKNTQRFSKVFEGKAVETALYELWRFVRKEIKYKADELGHEKVKSPSQTWKDRYGDCKSMSIFIGSVLRNLGIPYSYRFVAWRKGENISHVYIVAHTQEGDYVLDAVHTDFNEEAPFERKKDIKAMTQISYVHGINILPSAGAASLQNVFDQPSDPFRIDDSPKKVAPKRYLDYTKHTEGRLELALLDRKLEILQHYYGDPTGEIAKGRSMIFQAIGKEGLHRFSSFTGSIPKALQPLASKIMKARRKVSTAVKFSPQAVAQVGVGRLIDYINCDETYGILDYDEYDDSYSYYIPQKNREAHEECLNIRHWANTLNEHYEKSAHHVLYEFIDNPNAQPGVVTTKSVNHKIALGVLSEKTKISRDNFRLWTEVGIMSHNSTERKLGPLEPKDTIALLRESAKVDNPPSIGFLDPVTLGAIVSVVGILLKAISSIVKMVQDNKRLELERQIRGFGTPGFSGDTLDWQELNNGSGGSGGTNTTDLLKSSMLPLLLVGGGAFIILNDK